MLLRVGSQQVFFCASLWRLASGRAREEFMRDAGPGN